MQFNVHTHQLSHPKQEIYNDRIGVDSIKNNQSSYFSAGIHPWDIENLNIESSLNTLNFKLNNEKYIALGECGLDKVCGTDLDYQRKVFKTQLKIAHQNNIKVLIIHCVKAYQEILDEKLNCPYEFTWILHGFNGSKQLIKQMSNHEFYFSIGPAILNSNTKIAHCISNIPLEKLFLETDNSDVSIQTVYNKAAEILGLTIRNLENQISNNVHNILPMVNL